MELAIGLFSSIGTGVSAAATGIGSMFAAGAPAAAGSSLISGAGGWATMVTPAASSAALTGMQGIMTAGSMLTSLAGGIGGFMESRTQAALSDVQAESERLAGEQRALRLKRELLIKTGANRVAFAASGVNLSSADPIEDSLVAQTEFETGIEQQNARIRQLSSGMRGDAYRTRGTMDLIGAAGRVASAGANYGLDVAKRG